jgi:hypothetical protein
MRRQGSLCFIISRNALTSSLKKSDVREPEGSRASEKNSRELTWPVLDLWSGLQLRLA